jgi:hypothetical protein
MNRTICRLTGVAAALVLGASEPVRAHDWYPRVCCGGQDCAPVEGVTWVVPTGGGRPQLMVSSKHGNVLIPEGLPTWESKDGRMHICTGYDFDGNRVVLCFFIPPNA